MLDRLGSVYPLVAHGVGLSIASAGDFDDGYVSQLASWKERFRFGWVSEHLAAVRVRGDGPVDHHAGVSLPLAWDEELLELLVPRLRTAEQLLKEPLLLENGAMHIAVADSDMTKPDFLNRLTDMSGCRLLLDLHNLYVNCVNLDVDGFDFLEALDLTAVQEIHIAGGTTLAGTYLDSHAGPCPPAVWDFLFGIVERTPNLRGITFEFHESYWHELGGERGLTQQLERAGEASSPSASVHVAG